MTTYTTTADANGNWNINLGKSYTQGQKTTVTSKKDGVTETLKLNAPATSIGGGAISFDGTLTSFPKYIGNVTLEASITNKIEGYAFFNYNSYPGLGNFATGLNIKGAVFEIADNAFGKWGSAVSLTLPNSLQTIGNYAFSDWNSATSLIIPDSVVSIGSYAFTNWTSCTSLKIGASVKSIGSYAFTNMPKLTNLDFDKSASLQTIDSYAFVGSSSLQSLKLPDSLISIGSYAFQNSGIEAITLGSLLTSIGPYTFSGCKNLKKIDFQDGVKTFGHGVLQNCEALTHLSFGINVTELGSSFVSGCKNLQKITFNAEKPPVSMWSSTLNDIPSTCVLAVPSSAVETYKNNSYFKAYASQIVAI